MQFYKILLGSQLILIDFCISIIEHFNLTDPAVKHVSAITANGDHSIASYCSFYWLEVGRGLGL